MKNGITLVFIYFFFTTLIYSQSSDDKYMTIIQSHLETMKVPKSTISDLTIRSSSFSKSMNATNVYVQQNLQNIPIQNRIGSFVIKDDKVVYYAMDFFTSISTKSLGTFRPSISIEEAVRKATVACGVSATQIEEVTGNSKNAYAVKFKEGNELSGALQFYEKNEELVLSWNIEIENVEKSQLFSVAIDAITGSVLDVTDLAAHCNFSNDYLQKDHVHTAHNTTSVVTAKKQTTAIPATTANLSGGSYTVFPLPIESPIHGERASVSGVANINASPFGWHDTDGVEGIEFTTTRGNNTNVVEGFISDEVSLGQPDGGTELNFDYPFIVDGNLEENQDASITNLFYIINMAHDLFYQYGFDEESGNFQFNNYGKGGEENDHVLARIYSERAKNNASFLPRVDGNRSDIDMGIWGEETVGDPVSFRINNTDFEGTYPSTPSLIGEGRVLFPEYPEGLTGDLVFARTDDGGVSDLCNPIANPDAINGKIAVFISSLNCEFPDLLALQNAGAIAIMNRSLIKSAPVKGDYPGLRIPVISISAQDVDFFQKLFDGERINVTLSNIGKKLFKGKDSGFDNVIALHEYGHGITFRLIGGASTVKCLDNAENMREGWSDWLAMMLSIREGDTGETGRGIGRYLRKQSADGLGIRKYKYSTDMSVNSLTYSDLDGLSQVHEIGTIWGTVLWDLSWAYIDRDGFDPDWMNGTGGNNAVMQLMMDAFKLTPCSPGFIDGRDALLAAAALLPNAEANICLIWETFARRGFGYGADQGSSENTSDQTESFDLPPDTELNCTNVLTIADVVSNAFSVFPNPSNGSFTIQFAQNFDGFVSLFDINGRKVHQSELTLQNRYELETKLDRGVYLLEVKSIGENASKVTSKIVIQ